mgnify:CR=1 FL=1
MMTNRMNKVVSAKPREAAKLVYQWVKTGVITFREFEELYPLIDKRNECQHCGGMPEDVHFVEGMAMCGYCYENYLKMRVETWR